MLCTYQNFCTKMERGHSHALNPNSNQVMPASQNPASFDLSQFASHHGNSTSHTDLYNHHHQQQPPASTRDLDSVGWSNFENSHMNSASSSNYFPMPVAGSDQFTSSSMRAISRNHHYTDNSRGSSKDKNAVQAPGDYANYASPLSSSLNSGMQNGDEPCEIGFNMVDAMNFNAPESRRGFLPLMEGHQPDIFRPQMEAPFWHHHNHNHLFHGNYFSPIFQPGFTWVEQHRSNVGACPTWNNPTIPYFEGSFDFGNQGGHQGSSFGRSAVVFHSPSSHSQHHLQPVQGMQVPNYSHYPRIPALSHGFSVNNLLHHASTNISSEGMDSVTRVPRPFPSTIDEWSYRNRRLPQAATNNGNRMRILSAQDNAVLEFPGFHRADVFFDQHRDMRLDIDNMSYEELLALEEQIGDVKTGVPEDAILKNLKMRAFQTSASLSNSSSDTAPEIGNCIICQVEYVDNERIGTLRCGHEYHADCIKQWLLVKNLCPICKTSGLDTDEREK